jgi:hypothetical protein
MNHMTVQYEEISHRCHKGSNNHSHNKDAIYNATKAVARKSILMQITRARAVNGYL